MTGWAGYFFWAIPVFLGHLEELPGTHNQCCLLLSLTKPKYIRPSDHSSKCSRLKTQSLHLIVKSIKWGWVSSEEEMEMRGKMPPRAQLPAVRSSGDLKKAAWKELHSTCLTHSRLWQDQVLSGQHGSILGGATWEVSWETLEIPISLQLLRTQKWSTAEATVPDHHVT